MFFIIFSGFCFKIKILRLFQAKSNFLWTIFRLEFLKCRRVQITILNHNFKFIRHSLYWAKQERDRVRLHGYRFIQDKMKVKSGVLRAKIYFFGSWMSPFCSTKVFRSSNNWHFLLYIFSKLYLNHFNIINL